MKYGEGTGPVANITRDLRLRIEPHLGRQNTMLNYPVTLTQDANGSLLVGFPDLPFANAVGQDREDALNHAIDAMANAVGMLIDEGKPIPTPSPGEERQPRVGVSALATAKILLWNEMQARQVSKGELAMKLHRPVADVDLLFDLERPTDIELIEKAAHTLGKRVDIGLV